MNVEVHFNQREVGEEVLNGKVVVVIDVLRACTTAATALAHGARAVVPVGDMAEAGRMVAALDADMRVLGGERGGKKIDGYDAGNSPLEYTAEAVAGKTVVLNTSNGTAAFVRSRGAAVSVAGALVNAERVANFLRETLVPRPDGTTLGAAIICAGHLGDVGLEDVLCAGLILHHLWEGRSPERITDGAHIALSQYRQDRHRLARALYGCDHAQRLIEIGYGDDVVACARIDAVPVLPIYRDSRLVLEGDDKRAAAEVAAQIRAARGID